MTRENDRQAAVAGVVHDLLKDVRLREFSRIPENGEVYLDHTGSVPCPATLVRKHADRLLKSVLGNPHSENPSSQRSTAMVESARQAVLDFFQADRDEYEVVFTANATAAIRLVGESFPFHDSSRLVMTADNHNSINGLREYALKRGAEVTVLPLDHEFRLADSDLSQMPALTEDQRPSLFAFPAQSNFSGVQHPLSLIPAARQKGYRVFVDSAAFTGTNRLNLREASPDYACLSFYKMFGYPTGVGALLARRESLGILERPSFTGGTVEYVSVAHNLHKLIPGAEGFEDGTPNFLDICAVPDGLALLNEMGMARIHDHVRELTDELLARFAELNQTGRRRVEVYGPPSTEARGGTVAFNILDADGNIVHYDDVVRDAGKEGLSLRGGCFCNPGASEAAFGLADDEAGACLRKFLPGGFTPELFSKCMHGRPVGAVRASFGIASGPEDVDRLIDWIASRD